MKYINQMLEISPVLYLLVWGPYNEPSHRVRSVIEKSENDVLLHVRELFVRTRMQLDSGYGMLNS